MAKKKKAVKKKAAKPTKKKTVKKAAKKAPKKAAKKVRKTAKPALKKKAVQKKASKPAPKKVSNMNSVVHFEMAFEDRNRMAKFYNEAFGWKTRMLGEDMGNYVLASTGETDKNGMLQEPGMINGGFYQKDEANGNVGISLVLGVNDLKAAMRKLEQAGGKVLGEPMEIPGYGMYVSFLDTEGNRCGLMEPFMNKR